jgi:hypothetical protein
METLENDTFPLGETVSTIGEITMRVTVVHGGSTLIKEDVYCAVLTQWVTGSVQGYPDMSIGRI